MNSDKEWNIKKDSIIKEGGEDMGENESHITREKKHNTCNIRVKDENGDVAVWTSIIG